MTIQQFYKLLDEHNWDWIYGEAPIDQEEHREAVKFIKDWAATNPEFQDLYNSYQDHIWDPTRFKKPTLEVL